MWTFRDRGTDFSGDCSLPLRLQIEGGFYSAYRVTFWAVPYRTPNHRFNGGLGKSLAALLLKVRFWPNPEVGERLYMDPTPLC